MLKLAVLSRKYLGLFWRLTHNLRRGKTGARYGILIEHAR
jgi:hypothetical protein